MLGKIAIQRGSHSTLNETPFAVDLFESVGIRTGDDRLQRDFIGLLKHREPRTTDCGLLVVGDLNQWVRGDVMRSGRSVFVLAR
jgi:hypothetical protein